MNLIEIAADIMRSAPGTVKKEKQSFNFFRISGSAYDEVFICKILAALLKPDGEHGLGIIPLKMFLTNVLHLEKIDEYIHNAIVETEYVLEDNYRETYRRIDIVIRNSKHFIPIEVKINAGDQKAQCYTYLNYARKFDETAKIYYLTKDGKAPAFFSMRSEDGRDKLSDSEVVNLSFSENIYLWLNSLPSSNCEAFNLVVKHLADVISDFPKGNKVVGNKMKDIILQSTENLKAAIELGKALTDVQAENMYRFFIEVNDAMKPVCEKYGLCLLKNSFEDKLKKDCHDYYYYRKNNYPSLTYKFVNDIPLSEKANLCFFFEIYGNFYAGFSSYNPKTLEDYVLTADEKTGFNQISDIAKNYAQKYILSWQYMPYGGDSYEKSTTINFRDNNELYFSLFDMESRKEIIQNIVKFVDENMLAKIKQ